VDWTKGEDGSGLTAFLGLLSLDVQFSARDYPTRITLFHSSILRTLDRTRPVIRGTARRESQVVPHTARPDGEEGREAHQVKNANCPYGECRGQRLESRHDAGSCPVKWLPLAAVNLLRDRSE
jgi:hypothetical protein